MKVGADIESLCGKCGDVWHVIVALANGRVAKVQCKQCSAYHRHRPPGGATVRAVTAPRSGKRASKKSADVVQANPNKARRRYRPSETFEPGDPIDHPTFGHGVVQSIAGTNKISVLFLQIGAEKILVHSRG